MTQKFNAHLNLSAEKQTALRNAAIAVIAEGNADFNLFDAALAAKGFRYTGSRYAQLEALDIRQDISAGRFYVKTAGPVAPYHLTRECRSRTEGLERSFEAATKIARTIGERLMRRGSAEANEPFYGGRFNGKPVVMWSVDEDKVVGGWQTPDGKIETSGGKYTYNFVYVR